MNYWAVLIPNRSNPKSKITMVTIAPTLTLEEFLRRPETKPAAEFIAGIIELKPMPQGKHSRLQFKLCQVIAAVAETQRIAGVFPELRCTFGGVSLIPDLAIVRWAQIPRDPSGEVANQFNFAPHWAIEILSPSQSQTKVLEHLLYCAEHGTELGWLLNPMEASILAVFQDQRVQVFRNDRSLPILTDLPLSLTPEQVMGWLNLS